MLQVTPGGNASWTFHDVGSSEFCQVIGSDVINDGEWHHVVGVRDRGDGVSRLYLDGSLDGESPDTNADVVIPSQYELNIGRRGNITSQRYFDGLIDQIRVYGEALTASEVQALYQSERPEGGELKYVALGDSYSSGEGAGSYSPETNVASGPAQNLCHRSSYAWSSADPGGVPRAAVPWAGAPTQRFSVACSGAVLGDLYSANHQGYANEPAQLGSSSVGSADMITVTIGGNDAQFANAIMECLSHWDCASPTLSR
jgi:hypothetical protein